MSRIAVGGAEVASYTYDAEGRRVAKTAGGVTTYYFYDAAGQLMAEYGGPAQTAGTRYITTDHLGSTRLVTDASGNVVSRHDYLPFGEEIPAGVGGRTTAMGYVANPAMAQKFTGKERDAETELDYFGARYLSGVQGRFSSPDPTFLNVLRVVGPQRWNQYSYAANNPLKYVDPDGLEAVAINYPGYQVGVRGNFTLPLGHAGVVIVRKDGSTHYFEYGRYNGPVGEVRNAGKDNVATPSVQRDSSGKITAASMKQLLSTLSEAAGKGGQVEALVFQTAGIEDMVMEAYLRARQRENTDPKRKHYSLFGGYNCGTLICEAFDSAGRPAPASRSGYTPSDIFGQLRLYFEPSQEFRFTPKKEKVTSRICFSDEEGKTVCR